MSVVAKDIVPGNPVIYSDCFVIGVLSPDTDSAVTARSLIFSTACLLLFLHPVFPVIYSLPR